MEAMLEALSNPNYIIQFKAINNIDHNNEIVIDFAFKVVKSYYIFDMFGFLAPNVVELRGCLATSE